MKRRGKFYSNDEKETMRSLGLVPTKASGAGWVEKEDGYNEYVLVQLKVTDADSYRINKYDLDKLEYHASVEKKIPIFLLKFLTTDEMFAILRIDDVEPILHPSVSTNFQPTTTEDVENFVGTKMCRRKMIAATRKKDIEDFYEKERRRKQRTK